MTDRWQGSDVPRGAAYDRRFEDLAAGGMDVHGEAALVDSYRPDAVLDAGCGTGRVAIELSRRGYPVVGVDVDPVMLEAAHAKAPDLTWVRGGPDRSRARIRPRLRRRGHGRERAHLRPDGRGGSA